MKNKKLLVIPTLLLGINCIGCDEEVPAEEPAHVHNFNQQKVENEYLASNATCKEAAKYYYSCSCGEKGTNTFESGNANGHSKKTEWSKDDGYHWHACDNCEECFDKAEHTFGDVIADQAPTCLLEGKGHRVCSVCGYTWENITIPKVEHDKQTDWSKEEGGHWHACNKNCGEKLDYNYHDFGDIIVDQAPTCVAKGAGHYICSTCGYRLDAEIDIDDNAHDLTETTIPATCIAYETVHKKCNLCDYEVDIPNGTELGPHDYNEGVVTKEATNNTCGVMTYTCKLCTEQKTETIPHTWDHDYNKTYVRINDYGCARKCTYEGCDAHENYIIPHSFSKLVIDREPDGDTPGHQHYECKNCGFHQESSEKDFTGERVTEIALTKTMPVIGDTVDTSFSGSTGLDIYNSINTIYLNDVKIANDYQLTAEDVGKTLRFNIYINPANNYYFGLTDNYCPDLTFTVNGEEGILPATFATKMNNYWLFKFEYVIPECVHSYTSEVTTEPTNSSMGVRTYTCGKCGDTYDEPIAHLGSHTYVTSPVCKDENVHYYPCTIEGCPDFKNGYSTHSYFDYQDVDSDGVTPGTQHKKCTNCGYDKPDSSEEFCLTRIETISITLTTLNVGDKVTSCGYTVNTTGLNQGLSSSSTAINGVLIKLNGSDITPSKPGQMKELVAGDVITYNFYFNPAEGYYYKKGEGAIPVINFKVNGVDGSVPDSRGAVATFGGTDYWHFQYKYTVA